MPRPPKDPFCTAMKALRHWLDEDRFEPGELLVIQALAQELGLSTTPLREALAVLAGEGMLERRRGVGYRRPIPQLAERLELIELETGLARLALQLLATRPGLLQKAAFRGAEAGFGDLVLALIEVTGNSALMRVRAGLARRLKLIEEGENQSEVWRPPLSRFRTALAEGDVDTADDILEIHQKARGARLLAHCRDRVPQSCS